MAVSCSIVVTLFQVIAVYLLLLLISFASKQMQPILYAAVFFMFFVFITLTVIIPFGQSFFRMFAVAGKPYVSLLIGSAVIYILSDLCIRHIGEAGFQSLAQVARVAMKIAILTLWLPYIKTMIDTLTKLITQ